MPTLPLPEDAPIGGGDLPVIDSADVAVLEADIVRASASASIRDAIRSALTEFALEYQRGGERAAAQGDPRRATGIYLDGLGGDDRSIFRSESELDPAYRARVLNTSNVVTPEAILGAANTILVANGVEISAQYHESIDCMFMVDSTSYPAQSFMDNVSPTYTDRLYEEHASSNGGVFIEGRAPGHGWMSDGLPRIFWLRVPDLSPLDEAAGFMTDGTSTLIAFWMQDGTGSTVQQFFLGSLSTDIYQAIANSVERIVGGSIRWMLYVDPYLTS